MKVIIIPAKDQPYLAVPGGDNHQPTLEDLKMAVSGWIEAVDLGADAHMYINEEGKLQGLPPNRLATELAWAAGTLPHDDMIVGNAIVLGTLDSSGVHDAKEHDVPQRLIDHLGL